MRLSSIVPMPDDGKDEIIAIIGLVVVTALLTIAFLLLTYTQSQPSPNPRQSPAAATRPLR